MSDMLSPQSATVRPLNKGIILDMPTQMIPPGGFLNVQNGHIRKEGIERRGGYTVKIDGCVPYVDRVIYEQILYYDSSGDIESLLLGRKHLLKYVDATSVTVLNSAWHTDLTIGDWTDNGDGTITITDDAGTAFATTGDVEIGDTVLIDGIYYVITLVQDSNLTIQDHTGEATEPEPATYSVYKAFTNEPDWALLDGKLVITDNNRPLQAYDGSTFSAYNESQTPALTEIDTVAFFSDRLWIGGVTESGVDEKYRIRWTNVTSRDTIPAANYLDLPYGRTGLKKLLPLGNLLVAYFQDRIWFGRPTNITSLPYDFTPYDTGNVGLVSKRAVTKWLDAHWFIGQDDIYSFSATRALEPIGSSVIRNTIRSDSVSLKDSWVMADPVNERILFGFPSVDQTCSVLWSYYYKVEAWAKEYASGATSFFEMQTVQEETSWGDISGNWEDLTNTWSDWGPMISGKETYLSVVNDTTVELKQYYDTSSADYPSVGGDADPIDFVLETGDLDFNKPNLTKTVTSLALKVRDIPSEELEFTVFVALDGKDSWERVGSIIMDADNDNEGRVDFIKTGSTMRFRIQCSSVAESWTLVEMTYRVVFRGREVRYGE